MSGPGDGRRQITGHRPPPPTAAPGSGRWGWPRLAVWWVLLLGILVGRLSTGGPVGVQPVLDLAIALGLALLVAISYRRWVRGVLRSRARDRERAASHRSRERPS